MISRLDADGVVNVEPAVFPRPHVCRSLQVYLELVKQQIKNLLLPDLRRPVPPDVGNVHEVPRVRKHALGHYRVYMRMPVDEIAERLHRAYHCGNAAIAVDLQRVNVAYRIIGSAAELAKKASVVAEVNPQPLRNSEYPLQMRNLGQNFFLQPMAEQQRPLLVAGWAAGTLAARERHEILRTDIPRILAT